MGDDGVHSLVVRQAAIASGLDIVATGFGDGVIAKHAGQLIG